MLQREPGVVDLMIYSKNQLQNQDLFEYFSLYARKHYNPLGFLLHKNDNVQVSCD